jgi:benzodiazapine receptor
VRILRFVAAVLLCLSVGFAGSFFTRPAIPGWYASLNKPAFTPPGWLFGPVWTLLYVMMGVSLALVWDGRTEKKGPPLALFLLQLGANLLWSVLFFGLRSPLAAFVAIVVLWVLITATAASFWKRSRAASLLFVPYLAWVTFAAALNLGVVVLN